MSWSEMWLKYGQEKYNYDENFKKISDYALTHKIIEFQRDLYYRAYYPDSELSIDEVSEMLDDI